MFKKKSKNTAITCKFNIPVFDVYRNLGIDFNNAEDYNKFSFDGLHFNDVGNRMLADKIIEFLSKL